MDYYNINFVFFSLVLMRMSGFVLLNPIFARKNVPATIKTGFAMALTIIVYNTAPQETFVFTGTIEYMIMLFKEFAAGYVVGFVVSLFSYVVVFAGEFIDLQMGFSMAKIFDAQSNTSISLSSTYYNTLYMLLFFVTDAHIALINIIINSGKIFPYGHVVLSQNMASEMLNIFILCTVFAIKMAFPIIAIEFLCAIGMGMLMKAIPQINIFVVDIQLKIFVGLCLMLFIFTPMSDFLNNLITVMIDNIRNVIQLMA